MNYKGHLIFGIVFLLIIFILDKFYFNFGIFSGTSWIIYIPLLLFSFLLPDIDHQSSKPRLIITLLFLIMIVYYAFHQNINYIIAFSIILTLIWVMPFIKGWHHRGHCHSIIFCILISLIILFLINYKIALIFLFGAFSHLIADRCIKIW